MASGYAYIDGGYLRRRFYNRMFQRFGSAPDIIWHEVRQTLGVERVFYYDCDTGSDRTEEQTDEQAWAERQIEAVKETDLFHLRLGTLTRRQKRGGAGQKEVDVLLAVDMISYAFRLPTTEAILVAGDLDFRPVVEEVVRQGTRATIFYDRESVAKELLGAADLRREMSLVTYYAWTHADFQREHPLPTVIENYTSSTNYPVGKTLREGFCTGRRVLMVQVGTVHGRFILNPAFEQRAGWVERVATVRRA